MARAVLIDLMCVAIEGTPFGYLRDKVGPIALERLARRCVMPQRQFAAGFEDLVGCMRISQDEQGFFIPRMVRDELVRQRRAAGGATSVAHPNVLKVKAVAVASAATGDPLLDRGYEPVFSIPRTATLVPAALTPQSPTGSCDGFEEWWSVWSTVRGTNHQSKAVQAWLSIMRPDLVADCMACTRSYLASLSGPSGGYNPENFLFDQAKDRFSARFPPFKRFSSARDTAGEVANLARERWEEDGSL